MLGRIGCVWCVLGPTWGDLETCWGRLGASVGSLGTSLGRLEASLVRLGAIDMTYLPNYLPTCLPTYTITKPPAYRTIYLLACLPTKSHTRIPGNYNDSARSASIRTGSAFQSPPSTLVQYRVANESSPGHGNALQSDTKILHVSRLEPASTQTATTPGIRLMQSSTY